MKELIDSIKQILPISGQKLFEEIYNDSFERTQSEAISMDVAWNLIKNKFRKSGDTWVAMSEDFIAPEFFEFELESTGKEIVMNDENGDLIMDAVLASTSKNKQGHYFAAEDLESLANQINTTGSTLPDIKHMAWSELSREYLYKHLSDEEILQKMRNKKGVFKDIKAVVKEGKLWIRAKLDKRYKNHIGKFRGVSIETLAQREYKDEDTLSNRLANPIYMGFTFTDNPQLADSIISK